MPDTFKRKRLLLAPRNHLAYGQDFHNFGLQEHCGLTVLSISGNSYKWTDSTEPELVVTQNPDDPADANFIAQFGDNVAKIAHFHCRWDYFSSDIQKGALRKTLENITVGITPTKFHLKEMEKHSSPKVVWYSASNGVRPDLFRPATQQERAQFKRAHLLDADTKLVGYTGRIEPSKGVDILREICNRISGEPFALFIQFAAWQGVRETKIWPEIESIVQELRAINPRKIIIWPDVSPRFNDRPVRFFDVFVTPSLSEVQPLVVLEALTSGVPVVANDSTAFYDELRAAIPALPEEFLQTVRLEIDRFRHGAVSRETVPTQSECEELAKKLVEKIQALNIEEYSRRESVSALMLAAGYSEAAMNARISSIYAEAVFRAAIQEHGPRENEIYPLEAHYADAAPSNRGVVEYYRNGLHDKFDIAETGIRRILKNELLRTEVVPTHFRYELSENPAERLEELLRDNQPTSVQNKKLEF
jgi:1,2-diacylglycerol-3-alpha-glucose alpha-1,2-glucosyltransferase